MPRQIPPRRVETILQAVGVFINRVQEIPDFREDIAHWNAAWEAQFPSLNPGIGDVESLVGYLNPSKLEQMRLGNNFNNLRTLFRLQEELRVLAVTSVLRPDFCWKILTPAAREVHMLEGLLRTCLDEPKLVPMARAYKCDITLASLETDDGDGFLNLLKKYSG
jgi:hypothetical protein